MKEEKDVLIFSAWQRMKKILNAVFFVLGLILLVAAIILLAVKEWEGSICSGAFILLTFLFWLLFRFSLNYKRIEFYPEVVVFLHEAAVAQPRSEVKYADIRGACINASDEYGDHVRGGRWERDLDTLCVYCKRGEYVLFGVQGWGKKYSRSVLEEILRRADVPESMAEEGEYGSGSAAAKSGFAALGVEEEPPEQDHPETDRFDIDVLVGCELVTEKGVRLGKIIAVQPGETDVYVIEKDGIRSSFTVENDVFLDMDAARKKIVVDADRFHTK